MNWQCKQCTHKRRKENRQIFSQRIESIITALHLCLPSTFQYSMLSNSNKNLCKQVLGCGVKSINRHANANINAFSYMFLVLCCQKKLNRILIHQVAHQIQLLSSVFVRLQNIPYKNMITSQKPLQLILNDCLGFFKNLPAHTNVYEILNTGFGYLELMSLFFRAFLTKLGYPHSESYSAELNTKQIYQVLTDYFQISFEEWNSFYFFKEIRFFILVGQDQQFCFGRYYDTFDRLYENEDVLRKSILQYVKLKEILEGTIPNTPQINSMQSSQCSVDCTPQFGKLEEKMLHRKYDPLLESFGQVGFQFEKTHEQQPKKDIVSHQKQASVKKFAFDWEKDGAFTPFSENNYHLGSTSKFLNEFLPDPNPQNLKHKEKNQQTSVSCSEFPEKNKELKLSSCTCINDSKKGRNFFESNIINVKFQPVEEKNKEIRMKDIKKYEFFQSDQERRIPAFIKKRKVSQIKKKMRENMRSNEQIQSFQGSESKFREKNYRFSVRQIRSPQHRPSVFHHELPNTSRGPLLGRSPPCQMKSIAYAQFNIIKR